MGIQRRVTKLIKRVKDYSCRKRLEKLGWTNLPKKRMRNDLKENFKIVNGISDYGTHFFNISPWTRNFLSWQISKI